MKNTTKISFISGLMFAGMAFGGIHIANAQNNVNHEIDNSRYTVVIPSEVNIDKDTGKGFFAVTGKVKAQSTIDVSIQSKNGYKLKDKNGELPYNIDKKSFSIDNSRSASDIPLNEEFNIVSKTNTKVSGNYTDSLTEDAISSEIPIKTGYVFTGWKWGDVTMQPGDKIPKNWGDFTLTAQWSKPYKKGSILNIEGTKYIVLEEKEDDKALVMPINSIGNRAFQSTSRSDNLNFNTYEGSEIDSYLENNWYNSLPSAMKMAIQATNIKQASYSDNYLNAKQDTGPNGQLYNTISRHVYLPSVEEISKVVNLSNSEKIKSFLNGTSSWTRDSYQRSALPVMILDADDGCLSNNDVYMNYGVHPAFVIDLSKIDYAVNGTVNYK